MANTATSRSTVDNPTRGRWGVVAAALLLQFSIGAVYAWSVFSKALQAAPAFHLTKVEASLPFEVAIGMIFVGTYIGGRVQDRRGPRTVALVGGVIYAIGTIGASFAHGRGSLPLLVATYGVISGFGLGVAYIVPIAMLQKWFPDRRGLITGLAVGGFGFGAVLTSPIAQRLIESHKDMPTRAFLPLGIAYLVMSLVGASFFRNPPEGYTVPGWTPVAKKDGSSTRRDFDQHEALRTRQWYMLTAILTLNTAAGIALISQLAASATDIAGYTAAGAAGIVGILGVFNGGGRIFWAAVSDKIGRMVAFAAMLALQGVSFLLLPHAHNTAVFFVLAALIYFCYGGGFGAMPATASDFFGVKHAGAIYGLMLVGWSIGGVVGPQIAASLIGGAKHYSTAFSVIGIMALAAIVIPAITRAPRTTTAAGDGYAGAESEARARQQARRL